MEITRKTIDKDESYLRQISSPILFEDDTYKKDIDLLEKFCLNTECFALAAVQIGIPKRIIYLKNTNLEVPLDNLDYNESKILINPKVISRKGHTKYWEACLSCLDNMGLVSRPYEIMVEYSDIDGNVHTEIFKGFESTVLSHEIDHLDGILHMDIAEQIIELPREKRKEFREKYPYSVISEDCNYDEILVKKLL